jgi:hypothetical protein
MPITYNYLPAHSAIFVKATGVVSREDILHHLAALIADPSIPQKHVTLFDARDVSAMDLSTFDIQVIAESTRDHPSRIIAAKLAIVTKGDKDTLLAEQYEQLGASFKENTMVFYHPDVACKWLGIPDED